VMTAPLRSSQPAQRALQGLQTAHSGRRRPVAGYIVFALAAALAAFMLGVWLFQRFKARGSRGGRRY
jgi:flagellar biogenesis protein FliO